MSSGKKKLAAIDFDGTLINNVVVSHVCFNEMLKMKGLAPLSLNRYREICDMPDKVKFLRDAGFSNQQISELAKSHQARKELVDSFNKKYFGEIENIQLRDGVVRGLESLRGMGIELVVWSNATRYVVEAHPAYKKIDKLFSAKICKEPNVQEGVTNGSKAKDLASGISGIDGVRKLDWLKAFVEAENIDPRRMVLIGDTDEEPKAAHELGACSIALRGGHNSPERLAASNPHHIVDCWREIPPIVQRLFANGGPR